MELMDELARVYADGPQAGIHLAVTADRPNTVPTAWMAVTTQKWLFRLADPYDYVSLGLTVKDVPQRDARPRGDRRERAAHPARPPAAVARRGGRRRRRPLPAQHAGRDADRRPARPRSRSHRSEAPLRSARSRGGSRIGVRESDLGGRRARALRGRARDRRRAGAQRQEPDAVDDRRGAAPARHVHIAAIAGRRSPLHDCPALDRVASPGGDAAAMLAQLRVQQGPVVVLIDDAEGIDDVDGAVAGLLGAGRRTCTSSPPRAPTRCARSTATGPRRSGSPRSACCCGPNIDYDGDLVGATLPAARAGADDRRPRLPRAQRRARDRAGRAASGFRLTDNRLISVGGGSRSHA